MAQTLEFMAEIEARSEHMIERRPGGMIDYQAYRAAARRERAAARGEALRRLGTWLKRWFGGGLTPAPADRNETKGGAYDNAVCMSH